MNIQNIKVVEGRKFIWDGLIYDSQDALNNALSSYANDGFETKVFKEDDRYLVYSRREVKTVVIE